jgi:RNA polymerase sigma factor (sigma-70 family)
VTNQEEHIIIQNVLAGDAPAYATLVNRYKDMAVILAYNILLNRQDAEEVAQDAFVKAYTSLRAFRGGSKFSTWLYRIIVNTALNKKKLKKHFAEALHSAGDELPPAGIDSIPAAQVTGEHRKHIQLAMRTLAPNERLCITLYYLNELSVDEIRELTGFSPSNIKVLLYRGRKNLYQLLYHHLKSEITTLI